MEDIAHCAMASSFSILALLGLSCLNNEVLGVAVTAEKSLMRSETHEKAVMEFEASGAMHSQPKSRPKKSGAGNADDCDVDYPIGQNACECADPHHHSLILDQDMCIEAARQAGAHAPASPAFEIPAAYYHSRPKGCFMFPCNDTGATHGVCYFYNPIGNIPHQCDPDWNSTDTGGQSHATPTVEGKPVCKRVLFENGTADENGGCPTGYEVIEHESTCADAGSCLGYCEEDAHFRTAIHNQSNHDLFPQGCFIHKVDGCVYYNRRLAHDQQQLPTNPQGTPLCNVSIHTNWAVGGNGTSASNIYAVPL